MSGHRVGERVFAVLSATQEEVRLVGFGVYAGDQPRPGWELEADSYRPMVEAQIRDWDSKEDPLGMEQWMRDQAVAGAMDQVDVEAQISQAREIRKQERSRPFEERVAGRLRSIALNPKIELEGGGEVWGYQCWWGAADRFEEMVKGRRVVQVEVPQ